MILAGQSSCGMISMFEVSTFPSLAMLSVVLVVNMTSRTSCHKGSTVQMQLFGRPNYWCMDVHSDARPIGRSKLTVIHRQFGFTSTRTSLNRPFGLRPFGRPCTVDLDASKYTNTYCPFGQNLAVQMDALTPCIWTIQIHVCGPSICTTLEHMIGWSQYMLADRLNIHSGDVPLNGPNIQSLTVQMDDSPMDRPCYVNLDHPNGRRSNGPPMSRQFGPSKITVVDRYFGPSKNTDEDCNFGPSKITVGDRNFGPFKITVGDRNF